eukprot:GGOE01006715.1.p1 GENE.GGOE01006715.1~~GGOE01006715.1.p1  ORF type:complete len:262 (-),score=4.61 GGOE01006715.1:468-1253(-)
MSDLTLSLATTSTLSIAWSPVHSVEWWQTGELVGCAPPTSINWHFTHSLSPASTHTCLVAITHCSPSLKSSIWPSLLSSQYCARILPSARLQHARCNQPSHLIRWVLCPMVGHCFMALPMENPHSSVVHRVKQDRHPAQPFRSAMAAPLSMLRGHRDERGLDPLAQPPVSCRAPRPEPSPISCFRWGALPLPARPSAQQPPPVVFLLSLHERLSHTTDSSPPPTGRCVVHLHSRTHPGCEPVAHPPPNCLCGIGNGQGATN